MSAIKKRKLESGPKEGQKTATEAFLEQDETGEVYMIFGKTGWLGNLLMDLLTKKGAKAVFANCRMQNRGDLAKELDEVKPTHVLNCAGVTGRPNVDWCESHQLETIQANVIGTLTLAELCETREIHCTMYATGCIFHYDDEHPIGGKGFTEEDNANFDGSFYSLTKGMVERMLRSYKHTMVLRVRMPISDDLSARNFLTKISKYEKVVNIPNSMTVLYDMLPVSLVMVKRGLTGIYNYTNPGVISHNECLDLYKKYIDTGYTYSNFTVEEQAKVIVAARSNNELDTTKICAAIPDVYIPPIYEAVEKCYQRMVENLKKENNFPPKRTDIIRK